MRSIDRSISFLFLSLTTTDQQDFTFSFASRSSSLRRERERAATSKPLTRVFVSGPDTLREPVPAVMSYEVKKQVLTGHTSDVNSVDFRFVAIFVYFSDFLISHCVCSHSDVLVSGSNDKSLRIWIKSGDGTFSENRTSEPISPLIGHSYGVNCVRFSPFDTIGNFAVIQIN